MINGILNVYKERGFTSHDVVAKLRGILKQKKIGHTGTLDPEAKGVLPVCLGKATKVCDLLMEQDKAYIAELLLGIETDTQDMTGTIRSKKNVQVSVEAISHVLQQFIGEYDQIPPMYSARKVHGKKLYELARAGIEVERKPKRITISAIRLLEIKLPVIKIEVVCSKGTYIRTLCHDIGQSLGCGGCMQSLLRTRVGNFTLEQSLPLAKLQEAKDQGQLEHLLISIDSLFITYPAVYVKEAFQKNVYNGNAIQPEQCQNESGEKPMIRLYDAREQFIGIYQWKEAYNSYVPKKIFWEMK